MRTLIVFALALALSACQSGQGQQSLTGASMDWRKANSVPAGMVGDIINKRAIVRK